MENVYKKDYPMPIIREWKEHRNHQRKQCEMNKLRMNTSEMPRFIVVAFCYFTTLSSYPLAQLSKISNTPSELFQSVQGSSWPQANSKPLLTFKASPLLLCTSERNRRNAIGNRDQRDGCNKNLIQRRDLHWATRSLWLPCAWKPILERVFWILFSRYLFYTKRNLHGAFTRGAYHVKSNYFLH